LIVTPGDLIRGEDATVGTAVLVRGGNSTAGNNVGGSLTLQGGSGSGTAAGGALSLAAGVTGGTGAGAGVTILATNSAAVSGVGGSIGLTAGDSTGVADAGSITLTPGVAGGSGGDGVVFIGGSSALQFTETATVPGPAILATQGRVWLRSDSPNSLIFTDDAGTDWVLNTAAAGLAGLPGSLYDSLVFYTDSGDRNSYAGSGPTVTDILGNGTAGTLTTATYSEGAFSFNGTSGNLTFTKDATLDNIFDTGGTVIVFARPLSNGESGGFMVTTAGAGSPTPTGDGWFLAIRDPSGGRSGVEFRQNFGGGDGVWRTYDQAADADPEPLNDFSGVPVLGYGQWSTVAVVYDSDLDTNDPTFYINGTQRTIALGLQQTSGPSGSRSSDAPNDLIIGNSLADARTWDGDIAVVLFFNRALSAAEVAQVQSLFAPRFGLGPFGGQRSSGKAQNVVIRAGNTTGTGSDDDGGTVTILAGDSDAASFGTGGDLFIRAGDKTGGNTRGGNLTIRSGAGQLGSQLVLACGDMLTVNSTSEDSVLIHGADVNPTTGTSANPGGVTIRGGNSKSTGSNRGGAGVFLDGGLGDNTAGGEIEIRSGGQTAGNTAGFTGPILISTDPQGTGGAFTSTNDISILTEGGGGSANQSGRIFIRTGDYSNNGSIITSSATRIDISCGTDFGTTAVHDQGSINVTAGNKSGGGRAGSVNITAGTNTGTGGAADSGSIRLLRLRHMACSRCRWSSDFKWGRCSFLGVGSGSSMVGRVGCRQHKRRYRRGHLFW
jgi:hypothetical protein